MRVSTYPPTLPNQQREDSLGGQYLHSVVTASSRTCSKGEGCEKDGQGSSPGCKVWCENSTREITT